MDADGHVGTASPVLIKKRALDMHESTYILSKLLLKVSTCLFQPQEDALGILGLRNPMLVMMWVRVIARCCFK
jgi:hypothetical protein